MTISAEAIAMAERLARYARCLDHDIAGETPAEMRRGKMPEKVAAWRAFLAAMGNEMPKEDGA